MNGQEILRSVAIHVGKRKWLTVFGYAMGAATKPLFALAPALGWIFAAHQLGAAVAAYGAGLTRTLLLTYNPALFAAGAACVIAAVSVLMIRKQARARG